jgi:rubrerythrin
MAKGNNNQRYRRTNALMKREAATADHAKVYRCIHCAGIANILVIKHTEKGTWPEIEFCPFCGLTNEYPVELTNKDD